MMTNKKFEFAAFLFAIAFKVGLLAISAAFYNPASLDHHQMVRKHARVDQVVVIDHLPSAKVAA